MKNMKKVLVIALSLVLVSVLSVASTLAYLNSEKSAVNVMTAGNVQIQLNEQQRNEEGTALEDFEQGKVLTPLVGSAQDSTNLDGFGMPKLSNYQDKIVSVTNTGASDAYVRVLVATPKVLSGGENANGALHYNYGNRVNLEGKYSPETYDFANWNWDYDTPIATVTIDGVEYDVETFIYKTALKPGEQTTAAISGFYLDRMVDYDAEKGVYTFNGQDLTGFKGSVVIPVIAQATQVDGFATPFAAFETAFPYGENNENLEVWFNATGLVQAAPENNAVRPAGYNPVEKGTSTVNNLTVVDNSDSETNLRALYTGDGKKLIGDFTVSNSYLEGTYAMNVIGDDTGKLTVVDTDLRGWVSYDGFTSATFTNVTFGRNSNPGIYNVVRPYSEVTFENCEFDGTEFYLDYLPSGAKATFVNSTMNGELIESAADIKITYGSADSVVIANS